MPASSISRNRATRVSGAYNQCLLHLWSAERNGVRRILDAGIRNGSLRLMVQKLGQSHPCKIVVSKGYDDRTRTARRAARSTYQARLGRAVIKNQNYFHAPSS